MFRSIFMEGLARPWAGVRLILKNLVRSSSSWAASCGCGPACSGWRSTTAEVHARRARRRHGAGRRARAFVGRLGRNDAAVRRRPPSRSSAGRASCRSSKRCRCSTAEPRELGCDSTIVFFNDSDKFHWQKPDELVDVRSGVICSPNNFDYDEPLGEGMVRITALANFDRWQSLARGRLSGGQSRPGTTGWSRRPCGSCPISARAWSPPTRSRPCTIRRFTGHENGAVYGAPEKRWDGTTHLKNLFICGTDQGFVGIIGAMISGIAMANRHLLGMPDDDRSRVRGTDNGL